MAGGLETQLNHISNDLFFFINLGHMSAILTST